jgi:hypothetical protein
LKGIGQQPVEQPMRELRALTLAYEAVQDRILAVVNPGGLDSWSFWLTRSLVFQLLSRLPPALAATSPIAKQAPVEYHQELVAFEREAALASTQGAMSHTDHSVLRANVPSAELAVSLSLADLGQAVRLEIRGERSNQAAGVLSRADLRRVLDMLEQEVNKAAWGPLLSPMQPDEPASSFGSKRRIN